MHASLDGAAVESGAQAFDPNQKGGTSFVRRTIKYWVQTKDVLKVFPTCSLAIATYSTKRARTHCTSLALCTSGVLGAGQDVSLEAFTYIQIYRRFD